MAPRAGDPLLLAAVDPRCARFGVRAITHSMTRASLGISASTSPREVPLATDALFDEDRVHFLGP